MNRFWQVLILLGALLNGVACSNQWREVESEIDSATLNQFVQESIGLSAQSGSSNLSQFQQMFDDLNTRIYYAEGPSEFGATPEAVTPIIDWSFLGEELTGLVIGQDVKRSRVYLAEQETAQGLRLALVFDLLLQDDRRIVQALYNASAVTFSSGEMVVDMFSANGRTLVLRSFDVVDEALADVIQLEVYALEGGQEKFIGKVTTLAVLND